MTIVDLVLRLSRSGFQRTARRNCASSIVELAVARGRSPVVPAAVEAMRELAGGRRP